MRIMKAGSIGEIPPSTIGRFGDSARMACAAVRTMQANWAHSGSIVKSQCDRLFGSFQIITASSMRRFSEDVRQFSGWAGRLTDEHFSVGTRENPESRAAKHRVRARAIWNPPVRRIVRVIPFD